MPGSQRHVSYYRVSTARQGASGLGLEAQQAAVRAFLGADWPPVEQFIEIESGRKVDRPQLVAALAYCRKHGCRLVIARLDRLARNVAFISRLMEADVEFVAADMPTVNRLTIHILAAVAEEEARTISARTRAALAAWKVRNAGTGKRLGRPNGWAGVQTGAGAQARARMADEFAAKVGPAVQGMRAQGLSLRGIAAKLTEMGVETANGGVWAATQVQTLLRRLESGGSA